MENKIKSDIPRANRKIEGYGWNEMDKIQETETNLIDVERRADSGAFAVL